METMPLDDQMLRLNRKAKEREEKNGCGVKGESADRDDSDARAEVHELSDTRGFSWMPPIEDFVEQAVAKAEAEAVDIGGDYYSDGDQNSLADIGEPREGAAGSGSDRACLDGEATGDGKTLYTVQGSRKRRRPRQSGTFSSESAPRPPSYNEILLADKSFHNPHASEAMVDAFGIIRPFSFLLDVGTDDRMWGGAAAASPARVSDATEGRSGGAVDRSWFYDTVRDRQNRLWADTRVKKGIELARKGQHQAAIDIYTQALGMCPDHDDGLVARGAAFTTTSRLRQAVQDLSRALSLNPQNENASRYLKETRRRMELQATREPPGEAAIGIGALGKGGFILEGARYNGALDGNGTSSAASGSMILRGSEGDETSKSSLSAMLQEGAEGDALRKMRALLEEDERKRKRDRKSSGTAEEGREGAVDADRGNRKKSRKKEKKSKKKRSSSSRYRKDRDRDRRKSAGLDNGNGGNPYDSSNGSSSSASSGSDDDASDGRRRKKKKKHRQKRKKRSRARSVSPSASTVGLRNGGAWQGKTATASSASFSAGGEDSAGEEAHPILNRKKHSLWG